MKEQITSILELAKEYLTIKLEEEKSRIEKSKKWDSYLDFGIEIVNNIVKPYGGINNLIKDFLRVYDISALKGDIDRRNGKGKNLTEEDCEKIGKEINKEMIDDPIPYLVSALNDDLYLTIKEKYGISSIMGIPSIVNIDKKLVDSAIKLFSSKTKDEILSILTNMIDHNQYHDLFNIINSNLSYNGNLVCAKLLTLISEEISLKEKIEKEVKEEFDKNPIPCLVSALNNHLTENITEKHGSIFGIHPLNLIPAIKKLDCIWLVNYFVYFLTCENKEEILKTYRTIKTLDSTKVYEIGTIVNNYLEIGGKSIASHLLNLLEDEISTN